ncbi:DDE-type integrase/transposase/recombinase [Oligoflexia bacterium]|nr:DDE-type integrase/transposase/recombinase [Oligoflexia bacterium]
MFANEIKKRRRQPTRRWHIDEAHIKIGKKQYIWRAVDSDGAVLDIFVSRRRNKKAAKKFFSKFFFSGAGLLFFTKASNFSNKSTTYKT